MGQARLGGHRADLRRLGRPAARARASARWSPSSSGPKTAVFVPRGVGNAFQTLEDETAYSYLVNEHWSPAAKDSYTFVNLADETLAIDWPIPLAEAELSAPTGPIRGWRRWCRWRPKPTLIIGAQRAARSGPDRRAARRRPPSAATPLDLADPASVAAFDFARTAWWSTPPPTPRSMPAETDEGRREAWATNVSGVAALVAAAREHRLTLVHISSDYVFDGTVPRAHRSRAASHRWASTARPRRPATHWWRPCPAHYIVRTSWVIGEGSQLRPHHGLAGRPGHRARAWSTTSTAGSPSPARSPEPSGTCWRARRRTAPTTSATRVRR